MQGPQGTQVTAVPTTPAQPQRQAPPAGSTNGGGQARHARQPANAKADDEDWWTE
jgi:hypothetical protein